jgi:asparaginyl-tRNA synthetase
MSLYKPSFTSIKTIYQLGSEDLDKILETVHTVKGWVRFIRSQSNILFIQIYDGTHATPFQTILDISLNDTSIVYSSENDPRKLLKEKLESELNVGATIKITGKIVKSPAKGQLLEMQIIDATVLGKVIDKDNYLPGVKGVSLEKLRDHLHLRSKFKSISSVFRIRSILSKAVHEFFHKNDFHHLDPNVITTSDCEGAGEVFTITNLFSSNKVSDIPVDKNGVIDFTKDFFQKKAFLTVSSQLQLEALCAGMGSVYTTNPSFRAEPSKTRRHMASFTHLEWEIPFIEIDDLMNFSEDLVKHCVKTVLNDAEYDVKELDSFLAKGLINKLKNVVDNNFERISYTNAVKLIEDNKHNILSKFKELEGKIPCWGDDLGSYCERYICEEIYKKPVFVYNYPRNLKSFYMKQNTNEKDGMETVQGVDLLIPLVGELIGSSIREDNYDILVNEMNRRNMDKTPLEWYIDLRKNGTFPHGGAGLGFDRLVSFCTSMEGNIREATPFPVCFQECNI